MLAHGDNYIQIYGIRGIRLNGLVTLYPDVNNLDQRRDKRSCQEGSQISGINSLSRKPRVLLINPPIYDFAYFDLFSKPLGLLPSWRMAEKRTGGETIHINALDPYDRASVLKLGPQKRKANGTGKIFRQAIPWPEEKISIGRRYARYGILEESLAEKMAGLQPDLILITSGMTYWYEGVREAVDLCRRIHPNVPVAVGGIYATLMEDHCRRVCSPDYVLKGEGGRALREQLGERFPLPESSLTEEADWGRSCMEGQRGHKAEQGLPHEMRVLCFAAH